MQRISKLSRYWVWAGFILPLNQPSSQWQIPSYSNLKPNRTSFSERGLKIEVDDSSSPIFFKLPERLTVTGVTVSGQLFGFPDLESNQQKKNADDLPLRVGLVETNDAAPSWAQKLFSPRWIKDLFEVFPNRGIKQVHFLTLNPVNPVGSVRPHPNSDLLIETVALQQKGPGPFKFDYEMKAPVAAQAVWIQSDGDDTHSKFSVLLESLNLKLLNK